MTSETDNTFERVSLLIGSEKSNILANKHILVIGLGGVGGYAVEMLARSGIGEMTIVDGDIVQQSNINRQIIALQSTIGSPKAILWEERLHAINPNLLLHVHQQYLKDELIDQLLDAHHYDFVIDAIDTLSPKVHLIAALQVRQLPFISAMGAGAKSNPQSIKIERMDKVYNCNLARMLRKRLRKMGVSLKFKTVFSSELANENAILTIEGEQNKKSTAGTIAYMPAITGCYCCYAAIDHLLKDTPLDGTNA